ncbi:MAG: tetraacyldisaccharide 4'-kinase, partial [Gemmatimonadota bacterium]|nr:tetraacyldisaccharide 4'-kinase [Gemmatimonadota bacterium]
GHRVAILTRGYRDELILHKRRRPAAAVWGHPDRTRIARRAAAEGATVALLDDGFQHRRLHRDLDIVALDRDALRRTNRRALPAGPFRETWSSALERADAVVLTGREPWNDDVRGFDDRLREEIARAFPQLAVASLSLDASGPRPANARARARRGPVAPSVALTGIMKPNLFFDQARARCPTVTSRVALPDHGMPTRAERSAVIAAAGKGGVLITEKDLPRLAAVFDEVPLWVLSERLVWHRGERPLEERLFSTVPLRGDE